MYDQNAVSEVVDAELDELLERARARRLSSDLAPPAPAADAGPDSLPDEEGAMLEEMLGPTPTGG